MYKTYYKHMIKSNLASELRNTFESKPLTKDRKYMNSQLKSIIDFLENHNIHEYQNFIKIFYKYGCKSPEQLKLIIEFANHMKNNHDVDIILLKKRQLKQSNAVEKNILMNRLAVEYPEEYLSFLSNYFLTKYSQFTECKTKKLIEDLTQLINQLKQQINNIPFVSDTVNENYSLYDYHDDQSGVYNEGIIFM